MAHGDQVRVQEWLGCVELASRAQVGWQELKAETGLFICRSRQRAENLSRPERKEGNKRTVRTIRRLKYATRAFCVLCSPSGYVQWSNWTCGRRTRLVRADRHPTFPLCCLRPVPPSGVTNFSAAPAPYQSEQDKGNRRALERRGRGALRSSGDRQSACMLPCEVPERVFSPFTPWLDLLV